MSFFARAVAALTVSAALAPAVEAQAPPGPAPGSTAAVRPTPAPAPASTARRIAPTPAPSFRRSVVHHNPYPYPNYYENDQTAGFRNPGGTGRYREYYPPGNQFQLGHEVDPVRVAKFDQGGGAPDRAEQLQAEALGIQKYNSIQGTIDNYARPYLGFGYGVGGFGGFY
jgi:hypothetical protein